MRCDNQLEPFVVTFELQCEKRPQKVTANQRAEGAILKEQRQGRSGLVRGINKRVMLMKR